MERGRNLAFNICGTCHYNRAAQRFIGNRLKEVPGIAGRVYSSNLTRSAAYGAIKKYSDAELIYLIKTGIARDGRFIPYMLRPNIADADMADIITFLRSEAPELAPGDTVAGRTRVNIAGRIGMRVMIHPQPYREGIARPADGDVIAEGKYLVDVVGCFHCHSKNLRKLDYLHPEDTKGYMGGGSIFKTAVGKIYGSNLIPDRNAPSMNYTSEQFRRAVKEGINKTGYKLREPMQIFTLTDKQVDAIYAYLQTL
jgi:mono/diheme cytochrome c family protein